MDFLARLKQLGTSLVSRSRQEQPQNSATDAAEELWYEGQHESAPVGRSDTGAEPTKPPATPERRSDAK